MLDDYGNKNTYAIHSYPNRGKSVLIYYLHYKSLQEDNLVKFKLERINCDDLAAENSSEESFSLNFMRSYLTQNFHFYINNQLSGINTVEYFISIINKFLNFIQEIDETYVTKEQINEFNQHSFKFIALLSEFIKNMNQLPQNNKKEFARETRNIFRNLLIQYSDSKKTNNSNFTAGELYTFYCLFLFFKHIRNIVPKIGKEPKKLLITLDNIDSHIKDNKDNIRHFPDSTFHLVLKDLDILEENEVEKIIKNIFTDIEKKERDFKGLSFKNSLFHLAVYRTSVFFKLQEFRETFYSPSFLQNHSTFETNSFYLYQTQNINEIINKRLNFINNYKFGSLDNIKGLKYLKLCFDKRICVDYIDNKKIIEDKPNKRNKNYLKLMNANIISMFKFCNFILSSNTDDSLIQSIYRHEECLNNIIDNTKYAAVKFHLRQLIMTSLLKLIVISGEVKYKKFEITDTVFISACTNSPAHAYKEKTLNANRLFLNFIINESEANQQTGARLDYMIKEYANYLKFIHRINNESMLINRIYTDLKNFFNQTCLAINIQKSHHFYLIRKLNISSKETLDIYQLEDELEIIKNANNIEIDILSNQQIKNVYLLNTHACETYIRDTSAQFEFYAFLHYKENETLNLSHYRPLLMVALDSIRNSSTYNATNNSVYKFLDNSYTRQKLCLDIIHEHFKLVLKNLEDLNANTTSQNKEFMQYIYYFITGKNRMQTINYTYKNKNTIPFTGEFLYNTLIGRSITYLNSFLCIVFENKMINDSKYRIELNKKVYSLIGKLYTKLVEMNETSGKIFSLVEERRKTGNIRLPQFASQDSFSVNYLIIRDLKAITNKQYEFYNPFLGTEQGKEVFIDLK